MVIFTSACKSSKETMRSSTPLYNTKWTLKKIHNNGNEESVNTKAFIRFDKEKESAVEMAVVIVLAAVPLLMATK